MTRRRTVMALAGMLTLLLALLTARTGGLPGEAIAAPGGGASDLHADHKRGDDDDRDDDDWDDDSDDDDHSGHGRGRGRGGDRDEAPIVAPVIPAGQRGEVVIEIIDERFVPANATLSAGQRITFINLDDDEHTATGPGFDTGEMLPGEWHTVTVERAGDAPYVCQYHPEMTGEITVLSEDGLPATPAATPVAAPATAEITIDVLDFTYSETRLEIAPGTKVTWINTGVAPHTVTGAFGDSGMMQTGDEWSFVFTELGQFDYLCLFHPDMLATIIVTDAPASTSGGAGSA